MRNFMCLKTPHNREVNGVTDFKNLLYLECALLAGIPDCVPCYSCETRSTGNQTPRVHMALSAAIKKKFLYNQGLKTKDGCITIVERTSCTPSNWLFSASFFPLRFLHNPAFLARSPVRSAARSEKDRAGCGCTAWMAHRSP